MEKPVKLTLTYNQEIVRAAVFHFWLKTVGIMHLVIALVVLPIGLGVLLHSGDKSWLVGAFSTLFFLYLVLIAAIYIIHYRQTLGKLQAMGNTEATFIADDTNFTISSTAGSSTLPWSAIKEIWPFKEFWILLFSKSQFMIFPLAGVSQEVRDYIYERIKDK